MKRAILGLLAVLVVLSLVGCAANTATPTASSLPAQAAGWSVAVEGASKAAFTQADYSALKEVMIDATKKKKDGSTETNKYTGVLISDVLNALGAADFSTITLTASDGFAADITKDMLGNKAIFAIKIDGAALDESDKPIMSVLDGQASKTWVKGIVKITVSK